MAWGKGRQSSVELPASALPLAQTDRASETGKELKDLSGDIYGHKSVGDKAS